MQRIDNVAVSRYAFAARIIKGLSVRRATSSQISYGVSEVFALKESGITVSRVTTIRPLQTVAALAIARLSDGTVAVFSSGVNSQTAPYLMEGWSDWDRMSRDGYGFNYWSYNDATARVMPLLMREIGEGSNIYLFGHSGGGVLVESLAKALRVARVPGVVEIVTYGAPKPSGRGDIVESTRINRLRLMNTGDPVPSIPFVGVTQGFSIALGIVGRNYRPDLLSHGPGGILLDRDGTFRESDETDTAPDGSISRVGTWLAGLDGGDQGPHAIQTYIDRLELLEARLASGRPAQLEKRPYINWNTAIRVSGTVPVASAPQDPPVISVTRSGATEGGRPYTRITVAIEETAMALPVVQPSLRLRVQRSGTVYLVIWDDVIIGQAVTASAAKSIAGSFNRALRNLGRAQSVSAANLTAYISNFLSAASVNGGGVRPPILVQ